LVEGQVKYLIEIEAPRRQHRALFKDELADGFKEVLRSTKQCARVVDVPLDASKLFIEGLPAAGFQVDSPGRRRVSVIVKDPPLLKKRPAKKRTLTLEL
jgi:hypothetical protein